MAEILQLWRYVENPITSIDAHLPEEQSTKFHPDPIWNAPNKNNNNNNNNKMSSDVRSVPDLKIPNVPNSPARRCWHRRTQTRLTIVTISTATRLSRKQGVNVEMKHNVLVIRSDSGR